MARKKVKLQWIANDSTRRAAYKKRKKGLMKKVSELSTLCGISACAIIYSPYEPQPEIWPNHTDVHRVLTRFKSLPEMEQCKKMMNQESFLRERISKLKDQVNKQQRENRQYEVAQQQRENRQYEVAQLLNQILAGRGINDVGLEHLTDLACMVDEKTKAVKDRMEYLCQLVELEALPPVPEMSVVVANRSGVVAADGGDKTSLDIAMESLKTQTWFMDTMNPQENMGNMGVVDNTALHYPAPDFNGWPNSFFN